MLGMTTTRAALRVLPASTTVFQTRFASAGTIKWFDARKGFGFIAPADGTPDIFTHKSALKMEHDMAIIADDTEVEFEAEEGAKGMSATLVTLPGGESFQSEPYDQDRHSNSRNW